MTIFFIIILIFAQYSLNIPVPYVKIGGHKLIGKKPLGKITKAHLC